MTILGLGCRSASYSIYAVVSIIVWVMLMTSNYLAQQPDASLAEKKPHSKVSLSAQSSVILRRTAKGLACANALWIVLVCGFQLTGVLGNCWCDAGRFYLGSRAFAVIIHTEADIRDIWMPLATSTVLAK